jgi:HrpA-like RNA helicase
MRADGKYAEMMRVREGLPAWKERDNITNALESSRVLVVVGEVSVLFSCEVWT